MYRFQERGGFILSHGKMSGADWVKVRGNGKSHKSIHMRIWRTPEGYFPGG